MIGFVAVLVAGFEPGRGAEHVVFAPVITNHPILACSTEELAGLQNAYCRLTGPEHDVVVGLVRQADSILKQPVTFPPRGGQHNTFYQCRKCQMALKTVDDTHHLCPVCGKTYTGSPYDDAVFKIRHGQNLGRMLTAAWAYAITRERRYAEYAAGVLRGYAARYKKYPFHGSSRWNFVYNWFSGGRLFEQTLSEASVLATCIAPAYDLIHDSGALSDSDHNLIRNDLINPMLRTIGKWTQGINNWQSWHNAAMFSGGVMLNDQDWMKRALNDPHNGFFFQLENSLAPEGMWHENSWGYHFYALQALVSTAEACRRTGFDAWSHPALKSMFLLPAQYAMPDGCLPRFGDDTGVRVKSHAEVMETGWRAYHDPALLPWLSEKPTRESIMFGRIPEISSNALASLAGTNFSGAGHAILRSGGKSGLCAVLTYGPYGGFHGHLDKLSFVFYGYGRELALDPGRAASQAYRLPIHTEWYKATLSHNTVVVDRRSQNPAEGKCLFFVSSRNVTAVLAECERAYPEVRHKRLLVLFPEYLLVLDRLTSSSPRLFDWCYHNVSRTADCREAMANCDPGSLPEGFAYIRNVRAGKTDGAVTVLFADAKVSTRLVMAACPGTDIMTGDGPFRSVQDRAPLAMISRRGRDVVFAAVLEPIPSGAGPAVREITCFSTAESIQVRVTGAGMEDHIRLDTVPALDVRRNGISALVVP